MGRRPLGKKGMRSFDKTLTEKKFCVLLLGCVKVGCTVPFSQALSYVAFILTTQKQKIHQVDSEVDGFVLDESEVSGSSSMNSAS